MNATSRQPENDHERKDADVVSLFTIVLTLLVMCVEIFLIVAVMMHYFKSHEPSKTSGRADIPATHAEQFPAPRLEVKPGASLAELLVAENSDLNSYGWVNRDAGIVRIPIDHAMQLILQRGLPDVGAGKTPLSLMQARPNETASPPRSMQNQ